MKKLTKIILAVLFLMLVGCRPTIRIYGDILAVESTGGLKETVEVVYKISNGTVLEKVIDQSEVMSDGKRTVDPRAYLYSFCRDECVEYGVYPGNSNELTDYYYKYLYSFGI
jgi:hypothetical protein